MHVNKDFQGRHWVFDDCRLDRKFNPRPNNVYSRDTNNTLWAGDVSSEFLTANDDFRYINDPKMECVNNIGGTSIFCGSMIRQFGHQMIECMHRIWAAREIEHDHLVFYGYTDLTKAQIQIAIDGIVAMGGNPNKLIILTGRTRFEKLVVPERGVNLTNQIANPVYAKKLTPPADNQTLKLFVTRRYLHGLGCVAGESYIAEILKEIGYEDMIPERLTLAAQMEKYQNASHIVFVDGSAMYGIDLISELPNCRIGIINRRYANLKFLFKHKVGYLSNVACKPHTENTTQASNLALLYPHSTIEWLSEVTQTDLKVNWPRFYECEGEDAVDYIYKWIKTKYTPKGKILEIADRITSEPHKRELERIASKV